MILISVFFVLGLLFSLISWRCSVVALREGSDCLHSVAFMILVLGIICEILVLYGVMKVSDHAEVASFIIVLLYIALCVFIGFKSSSHESDLWRTLQLLYLVINLFALAGYTILLASSIFDVPVVS